MDVYLNGKKICLKSHQSIGKGGEADIYDLGNGQALKLFKPPHHPDYQGLPEAQAAAKQRIKEHQAKLRLFPQNLPSRVIKPEGLVTNAKGNEIQGFTMPLLTGVEPLKKYGDRAFRQGGISQPTVVKIFQDLYATLEAIHQAGVIIGDFNDLNVLVKQTDAYIIDADSFQFDRFYTQVFTARFVDPLLCDSQASQPILIRPYTTDSDWYALAVMWLQSLLFVDPYSGVYRPKNSGDRIPHDARPLHRITIFHPEVRYPKPAIPYQVLPDDLLHYFHQVFVQDMRGKLPRSLLDNLQWTKCLKCGLEHSRTSCPHCTKVTSQIGAIAAHIPGLITREIHQGKVTATQIFSTAGIILCATMQSNQLLWLYHDRGEFKREDESVIFTGQLDPQLLFKIQGKSTLIGKGGKVVTLKPGQSPTFLTVESRLQLRPENIFDTNEFSRYWIHNGQLFRDGQLGQEYMGDVLTGATRFWVGSHFGFGFYQAGYLNVAFVFDSHRPGINDQVKLPPWSGKLIQSNCVFTPERCWFFWTTQEQDIINHCAIILRNGTIEAIAKAKLGDSSWLGNSGFTSSTHNYCAAGNFLLCATDDGIIRIAAKHGQICQIKEFPDTEHFVDSHCQLFASFTGLYVVKAQEILKLQIG